jgi:macrodomain Ter protein organizer (MatP/YcbG family)
MKKEGLTKEEEAYVDKMLNGLASGKIKKWHRANRSRAFNSRNARTTSKTLAKSGISRKQMDGAGKYYDIR